MDLLVGLKSSAISDGSGFLKPPKKREPSANLRSLLVSPGYRDVTTQFIGSSY
jgi:hypothetical protein